MDPGPLLSASWLLFRELGPRLSVCTTDTSSELLIFPTAGEVRIDNPAIVPNIISFQLIRFIVNLLFCRDEVDLILARCVTDS